MVKRAHISVLGDVDIRLLRIFVAVTECGGFAASELELNIGRSTISKHIADLELRIGLKLCNRGPSGFSLTPEGQQVLLATRHLLSNIDGFQASIDDIHANLSGTLRIGLFDQSSTNPDARIHQAIRLFDDEAPDVSLEIVLDTPGVLEARVADGSIELAIIPLHQKSSLLTYHPLYREDMSLYCGRDHPLFGVPADASLASLDLQLHKYAGYSFNSPNMAAGRALGLTRTARVKEEEAITLLILSGRYLGYLANHVAAPLLERQMVWPICRRETAYHSEFGVAVRRTPEAGRKTQKMLECLMAAHGRATR